MRSFAWFGVWCVKNSVLQHEVFGVQRSKTGNVRLRIICVMLAQTGRTKFVCVLALAPYAKLVRFYRPPALTSTTTEDRSHLFQCMKVGGGRSCRVACLSGVLAISCVCVATVGVWESEYNGNCVAFKGKVLFELNQEIKVIKDKILKKTVKYSLLFRKAGRWTGKSRRKCKSKKLIQTYECLSLMYM